MMNVDVQNLVALLRQFAEAVGIDWADLRSREVSAHLRYTTTELGARPTREMDVKILNALQSSMGPALTMTWKLGDLAILRIGADTGDVSLAELREHTDDDSLLEFSLDIDKSKLLESWGLAEDDERSVTMFFFSDSLEQNLRDSLANPRHLEHAVWRGRPGQALVLVADCSIMVTGPFVVILGHSELGALECLPRIDAATISTEKSVYSTCKEAVRWENAWTEFLTPNYLSFSADGDSINESLVRLLAANGVNLALLFTADRIRTSADGFVASYVAANSQCEVTSLTAEEIGDDFYLDSAFVINKLASWAYDERWRTDRLRLLQVALTRVVSRHGGPQSCPRLLRAAEQMQDELLWHWKTFISDAVESYVAEETELENEIAETVDGYEAQVSSMIASLSGTMLAAVGVMIGSFIAAAFSKEFNVTIFALGIGGYMLYLILFPGIYNMLHHYIRYRTMNEIFEKRKSRFTRLLGKEATDKIVGEHISRAQGRFWNWFRLTVLAMVVVLILTGVVGLVVPVCI